MLKHLGNTSITSGVLQNLTLTNGVSFVTLTAPPTGIYILALPPDLGTSGQVSFVHSLRSLRSPSGRVIRLRRIILARNHTPKANALGIDNKRRRSNFMDDS